MGRTNEEVQEASKAIRAREMTQYGIGGLAALSTDRSRWPTPAWGYPEEQPMDPYYANRAWDPRYGNQQYQNVWTPERGGFAMPMGSRGQMEQYAATGPGMPGPTNVYVPNLQSSGELVVGYSRNVTDFTLPRYAQYVQSDRLVGYFLKLSPQEAGRVKRNSRQWPDGAPRPQPTGLEQFNLIQFRCERYDNGFTMGWMTRQQAEWPVYDQHLQIHGAQAMTERTDLALSTLTTVANWQTSADPDMSANHTADTTAFAGGKWDAGTSAAPYIKSGMNQVAIAINKDTLGVVKQNQGMWIINPNVADKMSRSSEVHEYIKGSYWAYEELAAGLHPNNKYGLPSSLYGYPILVEETVEVTSLPNPDANPTKIYAMPDQTAVYVSRIGGLEGPYGAPSFSTLTMFWAFDELTMETFSDPKHRLDEGHLVQTYTFNITSPLSGFLLTGLTS